MSAQNVISASMDGNDLCIEDVHNPGVYWYQYHVQNADNLSENFSFWSHSTDTCIQSPYCNARVSRSAFFGTSPVPSNTVSISSIDIGTKMWWDGQLNISIKGNWDEVRVTMWDLWGNQVKFQEGWEAVFSEEGQKILNPIMRFGRTNHPRLVMFSYFGGDCQGVVTKLIYI